MIFNVYARARAKGLLKEDRKPTSTMRRMTQIRTSMKDLHAKLERDLRSSDPDRFMTALVVGLMIETNEDPVYSWQKKNVLMDDSKVAYFRTRGRKKSITNSALIRALSDAYEAIEDDDEDLFSHDTGKVTSEMVGDYLSQFKLSVQDLRGFNASSVLQSELRKIRTRGPELPKQKKTRAKILRSEFLKGLEATSTQIGLEADLIRSAYLPAGLEASYLSDGSFDRGVKTSAMVSRVADRFLHGEMRRLSPERLR